MILDKKNGLAGVLLALFFGVASGCSQHSSEQARPQYSRLPVVVATTTTLASLVKPVAGPFIDVKALVPLGASPETFEPTPQAVIAVSQARVLIENGAGLESWLNKLLESASRKDVQILVLSDGIPGRGPAVRNLATNPHFWLDPVYAQIYVREIANALANVDPQHATQFRAGGAAEIARLQGLDAWTRGRVNTIPKRHRVMFTFHDAWYYFDKRYGLIDGGSVETSPGKEPSAEQFAELIARAKAYNVPAVFGEPEYSPRLIKALATSAGIRTVTTLYDDSLGNTPELSTYEGMMRHNVNTIVNALTL